jgi:hypothetical protein
MRRSHRALILALGIVTMSAVGVGETPISIGVAPAHAIPICARTPPEPGCVRWQCVQYGTCIVNAKNWRGCLKYRCAAKQF